MEQKPELKNNSLARNALNFGVILGVAMLIISLILYVLNLSDQKISQYLSMVLMIGGLIIGILNHKKNKGGFISYGQSLGTGVLVGLFASVIVSIYSFALFKFIDPGMVDVMLRKAEEKMLERNPTMTDEQIEIAMSYTRKFMTPIWMAISSLFWLTFVSFIASLIISIFTKKNDNTFESNFR